MTKEIIASNVVNGAVKSLTQQSFLDLGSFSPDSSWLGRTWTEVTSQMTLDKAAEITLAAGVALGGYMVMTAENFQDTMDGLLFAGAATSLTCFAWALGCAAKGENAKAARRFMIAVAAGGIVAQGYNMRGSQESQVSEPINNSLSAVKMRSSSFITGVEAGSIPGCESQHTDICFQPDSIEDRVAEKFDRIQGSARALKQMVKETLRNGGKIVSKAEGELGLSGSYLIKDKNGKTIGIFKPEDEGTYGPNNPNPAFRKPQLSRDDIYFHQVNSWEQGKGAERQQLAEVMHVGEATKVPHGTILELTSDVFFDLEAQEKGEKPRVQTKRGYFQEWVPDLKPMTIYHPSVKKLTTIKSVPEAAVLHLHDNPILDRVPLDQYQEVAINDMLLYNEDRHSGNLLVSFDKKNNPSLVLIDQDSIFPWKLRSLFGINTHKRAKEPFTGASLRVIRELDPDLVQAMVEKMDLSEQAPINARVMAMVIKRFAEAGATLHDIDRFVSFGNRDKQHEVSPLWNVMEEVRKTAIEKLSDKEKAAYKHAEWLRRADWCETVKQPWCDTVPAEEKPKAALFQKSYTLVADKIKAKLEANYWEEMERRLDQEVQSFQANKVSKT